MQASDARQQNMEILSDYYGARLGRLSEHGELTTEKPAPLSVQEIETVLSRLAKHPDYKHQTVRVIAQDGQVVTMRDGQSRVSG